MIRRPMSIKLSRDEKRALRRLATARGIALGAMVRELIAAQSIREYHAA